VEAISSRPRRLLLCALAATGLALIVSIISLVFGVTDAHASDDERDPGALEQLLTSTTGALGDVVEGVTEPLPRVTGAVTETVKEVAQPVTKVVENVPVVGPVAKKVTTTAVDSASGLIDGVSDTATKTLSSQPLTAVVAPITDELGELPVAGRAVDRLSPLIASTTDDVERILDSLGVVLQSSLDPITGIGLTPDETATPDDPSVDGCHPSVLAPATAPSDAEPSLLVASAGLSASLSNPTTSVSAPSGPPGGDPPGESPGAPPSWPPPSSAPQASGSGGGGGTLATDCSQTGLHAELSHALPALATQAPPQVPVFDTDIFPD